MIKQMMKYDCGVACLSMLLGKKYFKIFNMCIENFNIDFNEKGLNIEQVAIILKMHNIEPVVIRALIENVPAIATVPVFKSFHMVYYNGFNLLDPSPIENFNDEDLNDSFPFLESICSKDHVSNIKIPHHLISEFDWNYLREVYNVAIP